MNVSTIYNVNDVAYYISPTRRIIKTTIQDISIKANKDKLVIYYYLFDEPSSIEESKLYSTVFEAYKYLNTIILKEIEKLQ